MAGQRGAIGKVLVMLYLCVWSECTPSRPEVEVPPHLAMGGIDMDIGKVLESLGLQLSPGQLHHDLGVYGLNGKDFEDFARKHMQWAPETLLQTEEGAESETKMEPMMIIGLCVLSVSLTVAVGNAVQNWRTRRTIKKMVKHMRKIQDEKSSIASDLFTSEKWCSRLVFPATLSQMVLQELTAPIFQFCEDKAKELGLPPLDYSGSKGAVYHQMMDIFDAVGKASYDPNDKGWSSDMRTLSHRRVLMKLSASMCLEMGAREGGALLAKSSTSSGECRIGVLDFCRKLTKGWAGSDVQYSSEYVMEVATAMKSVLMDQYSAKDTLVHQGNYDNVFQLKQLNVASLIGSSTIQIGMRYLTVQAAGHLISQMVGMVFFAVNLLFLVHSSINLVKNTRSVAVAMQMLNVVKNESNDERERQDAVQSTMFSMCSSLRYFFTGPLDILKTLIVSSGGADPAVALKGADTLEREVKKFTDFFRTECADYLSRDPNDFLQRPITNLRVSYRDPEAYPPGFDIHGHNNLVSTKWQNTMSLFENRNKWVMETWCDTYWRHKSKKKKDRAGAPDQVPSPDALIFNGDEDLSAIGDPDDWRSWTRHFCPSAEYRLRRLGFHLIDRTDLNQGKPKRVRHYGCSPLLIPGKALPKNRRQGVFLWARRTRHDVFDQVDTSGKHQVHLPITSLFVAMCPKYGLDEKKKSRGPFSIIKTRDKRLEWEGNDCERGSKDGPYASILKKYNAKSGVFRYTTSINNAPNVGGANNFLRADLNKCSGHPLISLLHAKEAGRPPIVDIGVDVDRPHVDKHPDRLYLVQNIRGKLTDPTRMFIWYKRNYKVPFFHQLPDRKYWNQLKTLLHSGDHDKIEQAEDEVARQVSTPDVEDVVAKVVGTDSEDMTSETKDSSLASETKDSSLSSPLESSSDPDATSPTRTTTVDSVGVPNRAAMATEMPSRTMDDIQKGTKTTEMKQNDVIDNNEEVTMRSCASERCISDAKEKRRALELVDWVNIAKPEL